MCPNRMAKLVGDNASEENHHMPCDSSQAPVNLGNDEPDTLAKYVGWKMPPIASRPVG